MANKYDVMIVGAGLFGCVCAEQLSAFGLSVLVIDKQNHIGGTCYTEDIIGINVHKYGAHIFRTNDKSIFNYIKRFAEFNNYVNSPIAIHDGKAYNLPFNMNTFSKVWGVVSPSEAKKIINKEIEEFGCDNPKNLEEHAVSMVGKTIYDMFIKEYTEKQWGKSCCELPKEIIRRIPIRYKYDNNYYDAKFQGIPIGGYTKIFEKMLKNCDIKLNVDFNKEKQNLKAISKIIIYTGPIDEYFNYVYGNLEYRGLTFIEKIYDTDNYQGNAVINYSDKDTPYTRSIEHKHFEFGNQEKTVVSYEYPTKWKIGDYPYYPLNDLKNNMLYSKYKKLADKESGVYFGGRLGLYQYFDMQDTIKSALELSKRIKELII